MSTGGEVANALVCKTSIRGFDPLPVLHKIKDLLLFVISGSTSITHRESLYCFERGEVEPP
jgi:hypothetical protein